VLLVFVTGHATSFFSCVVDKKFLWRAACSTPLTTTPARSWPRPSACVRDAQAVGGDAAAMSSMWRWQPRRTLLTTLLILVLACCVLRAPAGCEATPAGRGHLASVSATVDLRTASVSPFPHFWKRSFGSGHALLGTRADWREALNRSAVELGLEGIRMHGILDDDLSVCPAKGQYRFYSVDRVYDYMLSLRVRPLVELSFMPRALVSCGGTFENGSEMPACSWAFSDRGSGPGSYRALVQKPDSFDDWYDLVYAFATRMVQRHGLDEVSKWRWEVCK
jgi:xylan 1,4-beta-xylosidase